MSYSVSVTALVLLGGILISNVSFAQESPVIGTIVIDGSKQGTFKATGKNDESLPLIGFNFDLQSPRDANSGLPTGKRMYSPITVTRYSDAASAAIFSAVADNESLKSVTIQLIKKLADGKTQVYETIKLQSANISGYMQYEGTGAPVRYGTNTSPVEEVQITFQKITWQMTEGKTTASDDWSK